MSGTEREADDRPLSGARIGILEGRMTGELAKLVERRGGIPVIAPALREVTSPAADEVGRLIDELGAGKIQVVVFLTGVGAEALFAEAERQGRLADLVGHLRSTINVSRGQKPWRPLKERGVPISVTSPSPYTTEEVRATLAQLPLAGKGVALLHYGERSEVLAEAIRTAGGKLLELCLYEWRLPADVGPLERLIDQLIAGEVAAVLFTSKVQVRHLVEVASARGRAGQLVDALNTRSVAAAVGPTTAHELDGFGIQPRVVPENPKMGPMLNALGAYLARPSAA